MRSIWNGAISFGLVSIPIKLVNATENHSISFRQIHTADGGRIRYRKVCELEEKEVTAAEIGKAYEAADGTLIPITDEDLASLPLPTAKTIEIVAFVPASSIDPLQMDAAYYLSANGVPAVKPYILLREALKRSEKVAVAKFALRGRERLGVLRVVDDVIAMHGLLWPDEIRSTEDVAPDAQVTVREAELDLADALMDTLGEVDLDSLHDDYRAAVEAMIAAKAEGGVVPEEVPAEPGGGKVIDLMAALENSVRVAKEARGEEGREVAEVTPIKGRKRAAAAPKPGGADTKKSTAAAKKTAPKKTAPKKTASGADKSTAGKSTATRSTTAKSTAKKTSATKSAATKSTATKSTTARSTTAGSAAEKSTAKKSTAKKATAKKRATA
ncbi:non-homologous end joining protein Ku [Streptomyces sp. NBC_01750]|uniref:non-homologous end joining protein Ku n=1 Tax=Streptomyces sp. NBC_01750 TaxID=2975928 RepID=UPI002DD88344|nr:Ku protein [Streptomyces sp. NBC_01750]WSD35329.1 Ku protein [Streptomyces sp. NBC_01750]